MRLADGIAAVAVALAVSCWLVPAQATTSHRHRTAHSASRSAARVAPRNLRAEDPSPAGAAARTTAAPGGENGGAGSYGQVGNPYSQSGYGQGAFGNGRPSPR